MSTVYLSRGWMALAEKSGSPHFAARLHFVALADDELELVA
ncbi:hypothetical protein [Streptomyces sp. NPDC002573]